MYHDRYHRLPNNAAVDLVQRLKEQKHASKDSKGIDKFFSLDYMGSSEFEWGAIPKALKEWRSHLDLLPRDPTHLRLVVPHSLVKSEGDKREVTLAYVGPPEWKESVEKFIQRHLNGDPPYMKERTDLTDALFGDRWSRDIVGWWDILNHWAIFKNAKHARNFMDGLKDPTGVR